MIYFLLLLTIYIWPFGQLLTFTNSSLPFTIYYLDIAVLFVLISLLISSKRKEIFSGPIIKPLVIFLGVAIFSLLVNLKRGISSGLPLSTFYLLRLVIYHSLFFASQHVGFTRLKKPLMISLGIFLLLGILQYAIFPDMRYLKNLGFDDHYFRLIGSFYDPNFTGAVLAAIALYFVNKSKIFLSIPFVCLLGLTFSRASYLVFVVGLVYILVTHKKIKLFFLLILLGIIIYVIPKPFGEGVNLLRTFSIYSRLGSWQQGGALFLDKPLLGWGYNTLRGTDNSRFQIDNSYLFLLATTGLFGIIAFINLFLHIIKNTTNESLKILAFAILFHSLFNNSLFYIWISALYWFALGLGQTKIKGYKQA